MYLFISWVILISPHARPPSKSPVPNKTERLRMLFKLAKSLKESADNADFQQADILFRQYHNLRDRIIELDPDASKILPDIRVKRTGMIVIDLGERLQQTRVIIHQMVSYLNEKTRASNQLIKFTNEKVVGKVVSDPQKVFIVHGRDELLKTQLARMLEKMKMEPIILHEQPSRGMTLIEKLEYYSRDIGYAFIILTPDDLGCLKEDFVIEGPIAKMGIRAPLGALKPRARQNVVFELGWFQGKLGRDRVCLLYKKDVELPTDINGMVYSEFKESVEECYRDIVKELRDAGYKPQV